MKTSNTRNSDPKETNPKQKAQRIAPAKPGNNPDQTPEREIGLPPIAQPGSKKNK